MRRKIVRAVVIVVFLTATLVSQIWVQRLHSKEVVRDYIFLIPSLPALKVMSLEYRSLVADALWLRAIQYFGGWYSQMHKQPKGFINLIDAVVYLDPKFLGAYSFGSFCIVEGLENYDAAVDLLKRGAENNRDNPEAWRLMFDAGFIRFYHQKDNEQAKELLLKASQMPGADSFVERTIAYIDSVSGRRAIAIQRYKKMYEEAESDLVRRLAKKHLVRIAREEHIEQLDAAIEQYRAKEGRNPESLLELVQKGYVVAIPEDPGESKYVYLPAADRVTLQESIDSIREEITRSVKALVSKFEEQEGRKPTSLLDLQEKEYLRVGLEGPEGEVVTWDPESEEVVFSTTGEN